MNLLNRCDSSYSCSSSSSAAMLCPVLLCAALLLLTPLEITEARALHPSPDAVQVQEEIGVDVKSWIKKNRLRRIQSESRRVHKGGQAEQERISRERVMKCITD